MTRREFPSAVRWIVRVLRPVVMVLTKRDWRGVENLPDGGFVLAANHISHADPLMLGHFLVDQGVPPRFLAKASMFQIPVLGRLVGAAGQIQVHRDSQNASDALTAAVSSVHDGHAVVIYPEGTITRDPDLWPMVGRTGAARIALTTGCPVIPLAQWGPEQILAPYGKRLHLFPRRTMQVRVGGPVDLDDLRDRDQDAAVLAEASERILAAISMLLADLRGKQPPPVRFDPREPGVVRPRVPDDGDEASEA